jgi:hypothetical protein
MKYIIKKQFILPFASFAVLSGLIFGGSLFGDAKFPITWTPEKIEKNQFIGTSQVINATFKSSKDLENIKFWLTPRLNKYAKIQPETIAKAEKDKEYTISIIVSIPTDFKTRKREKDDFKSSLKTFLDKDFDEKEYNKDFKFHEEFLKDFRPDKILGLLFVAEEKQTKWPNFIKQKRSVKRIYPLPLKIAINVKKATAEVIPLDEVSLPIPERIYEDTQTGAVYVKDEIIIGFKEGTTEARIKEIVAGVNGTFLGSVPDLGMYQIQVSISGPSQLEAIIQQLETYSEVGIATYSLIIKYYYLNPA